MREDYLRNTLGITHVLTSTDQATACQACGVTVVSVPSFDEGNEQQMAPVWDATCDSIDAIMSSGGTLLVSVHGRSRSASIVICWLIRAHGLPVALAASLLKAKCPSVDWSLVFPEQIMSWADGKAAIAMTVDG